MKFETIPFCVLLMLCGSIRIFAQCNSEYYYKAGAQPDPTVLVLEDTTQSCSYLFWGSTVDTNSVTGQDDREIWIVKLDPCGTQLWKKHIGFNPGVSGDFFSDAIFTADSNILILGHGFDVVQGVLYSGTLFKINRNGQLIWKKAYGGIDPFSPRSITYNSFRNSYFICGAIERKRPNGLLQRAYIMEIDSMGNMLREKDILLDYDSIAADKKELTFDKVAMVNDSTLAGLISSDRCLFACLNNRFDLLWYNEPDTFNRGWSRAYRGYDPNRQEFVTMFTNTPQQSAEDRWICRININGEYTSRMNLGHSTIPYPFTFSLTHDKGYLFYGNVILKVNAQYHHTDTFLLPHIEDYAPDDYYGAPRLDYATQLRSGAYIGIGISGYRSNWDYAEVYIIQTDKDGNFTPDTPQPTPTVSSIIITPNPSYSGIYSIKAGQILYETVTVYTSAGQLVLSASGAPTSFDLSQQPNGMYTVHITNNQQEILVHQKIVLLWE